MLAGTYLGLVEKLDYLQRLGINAVELLPVQEFNELEYYQVRSLAPQPDHTCIDLTRSLAHVEGIVSADVTYTQVEAALLICL